MIFNIVLTCLWCFVWKPIENALIGGLNDSKRTLCYNGQARASYEVLVFLKIKERRCALLMCKRRNKSAHVTEEVGPTGVRGTGGTPRNRRGWSGLRGGGGGSEQLDMTDVFGPAVGWVRTPRDRVDWSSWGMWRNST